MLACFESNLINFVNEIKNLYNRTRIYKRGWRILAQEKLCDCFYPILSKLGIQLHLGPRYTFIKKKKRNIFKLLTLQASKQVFLTTTE